jgi:hypothetical protein
MSTTLSLFRPGVNDARATRMGSADATRRSLKGETACHHGVRAGHFVRLPYDYMDMIHMTLSDENNPQPCVKKRNTL